MKIRRLNFVINTLTYDDSKKWNQCYFDFFFNGLSLAKSKRKAMLRLKKLFAMIN